VRAAHRSEAERQREEHREDEHDLEGAAVVGGDHHSRHHRIAGQHDRLLGARHLEELAQAEDGQHDQRPGEEVPSHAHDDDREDRPRDRDDHAGGRLGHLRQEAVDPLALGHLRALRARGDDLGLQRFLRLRLRLAGPEVERGRLEVLGHRYLAPKRRWRSS
jgi:hypothetical protein